MSSLMDALLKAGMVKPEEVEQVAREQERKRPARSAGEKRRETVYSSRAPQNRAPGQNRKRPFVSDRAQTATAPYNFVSLPNCILPSPLQNLLGTEREDQAVIRAAYKQYLSEEATYIGRLELELTTLTPCFIGGDGENFFAPTGRPRIPGSSLRGMTRNLFKLVTCGSMRPGEDFDDRHLYVRCLMATEDTPTIRPLHDYYKSRMGYTDQNGEERKKTHPGFLVRIKNAYFICPAQCKPEKFRETGMKQPQKAEIIWREKEREACCLTGYVGNAKKESYRVLYGADWERLLPVAPEVVEGYRRDKKRGGINLLTEPAAKQGGAARAFTGRSDVEMVVPCFYGMKGDAVQHFGHGRSYRIPYEDTIAARVPAAARSDIVDFADAVFGRKALWAGRVQFDDALLEGEKQVCGTDYTKPLSSPNPTSFQLYLKQQAKAPLRHWDEETQIRGCKLYWHQKISDRSWQLGKQEHMEGQSKITPLRAGSRFRGQIRFADLTKVELGALLKVFALQDGTRDICYKLGMGKPLGMGSVRVVMKLRLIDEKKRYASLFGANGWEEAVGDGDPASFIAAFDRFVAAHIGDLEAYRRSMTELRDLLDWKQTQRPDWLSNTAYMPFNDKKDRRFLERTPLPPVEKVVKPCNSEP